MSNAANVIRFPSGPTGDETTHAGAHRHVGRDFLASPTHANHFVQFYEDEAFLFEMVSEFLGSGLRAGDRIVVIATPEHAAGFLDRLGAHEAGRVHVLDARETLARFMVDGMPDASRFREVIAGVMAKVTNGTTGCVRAYGEMVDLLWRDGNPDAAIRLEEFWNDASQDHSFSLFCAYVIGNFYKEKDASPFYTVCKTHTHVIPPEGIVRQRALEKEVAHRAELEETLRRALRSRTEAEEELRACLRREQEARAEAEAGIQFREVFVGMLGHDLRNPLNTMLNSARLVLMTEEVPDGARKRLERMVASGVRMEKMIAQLLDLTRLRLAGGITVERTFQDVDPIIARIVHEARASQSNRLIEYVKQGDCFAEVDADRIEQVVSNLVGNSLTHGAENEAVRVMLTGSALSLQLSVRNGGKPIPPEAMAHLFDPFKKTKSEGKSAGLGLGLYIVERIVQAHGGLIHVASSPDGTVFEVTLSKRASVTRYAP